MCSFAKFLALGLIAADGASAATPLEEAKAAYTAITGLSPGGLSTEEDFRNATCVELDKIHKLLTTEPLGSVDGVTPNAQEVVSTCTAAGSTALQNRVLALLTKDYAVYNSNPLSLADPDVASKIKTVHDSLMNVLKTTFHSITVSGSQPQVTWPTTFNGTTYRDKRREAKGKLYEKRAAEYFSITNQNWPNLLSTTSPYTNQIETLKASTKTAAADKKEKEAAAAKKKKADDEAAERAEAVGGFFGVFLGLVGLTLGFLMSPCVQFDFNTGKTATNWATGTPDEEWTQMDMYKEAYKTDKTPGEWRDEVFGLPEEQPVDSAKATSSALTLVPVVVLAGGVFAVARRGLKRRAQKKAKRVSRAQQKLHEDL